MADLVQELNGFERQKRRLSGLFEQNSVGIAFATQDGTLEEVNPGFAAIMGATPDELVGKTIRDITHPLDIDTNIEQLHKLLAGEIDTYTLQKRYTHKIRDFIWVEVTVSAIRTDSGEIDSLIAMVKDITAQREAEQRKDDLRFRELFDAIDDSVFLLTFEGKIIETNRAAKERLGYSLEEMTDLLVIDGPIPSDRAESVFELMEKLKENGQILFEANHRTKEGHVFPVEVNAREIIHNGEAVIISIARDISKRKELEKTHKQLQLLLEELVENSPSIICIHEPDGKYRLVNKKFEEFVGLPRDLILGKSDHDLFPKAIADTLHDTILRVIDSKMGISTEERFAVHGNDCYLMSSRFPLLNSENEIIAICAIITDVTEDRELQDEKNRFFAMTTDFVGVIDFNGMFRVVNAAIPNALGCSMEELCRKQFIEMIHPDDRPRTLDAMSPLFTGIAVKDVENRYIDKDGDTHWLLWRCTPDAQTERIYFVAQDITEKREMIEQTSLLNERLSLAKKAGTIGIWDWDIPNDLLIWDEEMYKLYGLECTPLDGAYETWLAGLHPDDVEQGKVDIAAALQGEREFSPSFRVVWPDKSIHYIQAYATVFRNESGDPIRMVGVNYDVTKQIENEQQLRARELELQDSQKLAGLGSYVIDILKGEFSSSTVLDEIFGITSEYDHSIDGWQNLVSPLWTKQVRFVLTEIVLGLRNQFDMEYQIVKPVSGELRWVHGLGKVEQNSKGTPVRLVGTITDITDRKKSEEDLHEREEKYRLLTEFTSDVIWVLNLSKNRFTYVSPAIEYLSGFTAEEVLDMSLVDTTFPEFIDLVEHHIRTSVDRFLNNPDQHESSAAVLQMVCKNGGRLWVEVVTQLRFSRDGEIEMVGVTRDIEKRKKMEDSLIAARDEADAANRAKSEFLANMSHEIRTPLNAVIGFSELLSTEVTDPRQKNYLTTIRNSGKSLLQLINDILDLSKIEAGKMDIIPQPTDFHRLLREVSALFQLTAEQKGLDFGLTIAPDVPESILVDEGHLRQVLVNIIGNAVKFTDTGHVLVAVNSMVTACDGECRIECTITDTGIGILPEHLERIFENFRQQEGHSYRRFGGTGLGLAISRRMVELMNGEITVQSVAGEGTTFTITLVVKKSATYSQVKKELWSDIRFNGETALVVDDIDTNLAYIYEVLTHVGMNVVTCTTGLEAIDWCSRNELPDLILLDIRMPDIDGFETFERLQGIEGIGSVPIIALTASATREEEQHVIMKGFAEYLTKPIEPGRLFESLSNHLERSSITEEPQIEISATVLSDSQFVELDEVESIIADLQLAVSPVQFNVVEAIADQLMNILTIPELISFAENLKDAISAMDILTLVEAPEKLAVIIQDLREAAERSGGAS